MLQHLLAVFQQLVQGLLLMLQTIQCLKRQLSFDALDSVVIPARSISDGLAEHATRRKTAGAAQPPAKGRGATPSSMQNALMLSMLNLATKGSASNVADNNSLFSAVSQQQQRLDKGNPWFQDKPF